MTQFIFLDVETTGLNADRDAIIEFGAVLYENGNATESFSSLVNPEQDIPLEITQLTGITNGMVRNAPTMFELRPRLQKLIGDKVIVGHNVGFDIRFLQAEHLAYGNQRIDTITLASILLPHAGRYGLEALVELLDLPKTTAHRAEADAWHTVHLYDALRPVAMRLEMGIVNEIVETGSLVRWPEAIFFQEILQEQLRLAVEKGNSPNRIKQLFKSPKLDGKTLVPPEEDDELAPIDVSLVQGMLKPGSNFSKAFPGFEPREQQLEMVSAVAAALNKHEHLLVEAGTGTGKSLSYLLPAAFWATENQRRVVISTNTINLQDQLIHKDIPMIADALPFELRVAVRKGRSNYLCARLFAQMRNGQPDDRDAMSLLARLLVWLRQTDTGDITEITLRTPGERAKWREISGERARCSRNECSSEHCPLHFARRRAELAHIVIVNHALLLADVQAENLVLPQYSDLIIDEAHHLEDSVTRGLSASADQRNIERLLNELTRTNGGVFTSLVKAIQDGNLQDDVEAAIEPIRSDCDRRDSAGGIF